MADRALQDELLATDGCDEFVALVVRLAGDAGFDVVAQDVEDALRTRRREWRARWV